MAVEPGLDKLGSAEKLEGLRLPHTAAGIFGDSPPFLLASLHSRRARLHFLVGGHQILGQKCHVDPGPLGFRRFGAD